MEERPVAHEFAPDAGTLAHALPSRNSKSCQRHLRPSGMSAISEHEKGGDPEVSAFKNEPLWQPG